MTEERLAKAFFSKLVKNFHFRFFMNAVGVTRQHKSSEEADNRNWITGAKDERFSLSLDHIHCIGDIAQECLPRASGAIRYAIKTAVYRSAIVLPYSF